MEDEDEEEKTKEKKKEEEEKSKPENSKNKKNPRWYPFEIMTRWRLVRNFGFLDC